jgi:hypothetical protein
MFPFTWRVEFGFNPVLIPVLPIGSTFILCAPVPSEMITLLLKSSVGLIFEPINVLFEPYLN